MIAHPTDELRRPRLSCAHDIQWDWWLERGPSNRTRTMLPSAAGLSKWEALDEGCASVVKRLDSRLSVGLYPSPLHRTALVRNLKRADSSIDRLCNDSLGHALYRGAPPDLQTRRGSPVRVHVPCVPSGKSQHALVRYPSRSFGPCPANLPGSHEKVLEKAQLCTTNDCGPLPRANEFLSHLPNGLLVAGQQAEKDLHGLQTQRRLCGRRDGVEVVAAFLHRARPKLQSSSP